MANLTRDPSRTSGVTKYLSNALNLVVKVDGVVIPSDCILDIFQDPVSDKPPRVVAFNRGSNGKFQIDSQGLPTQREIQGHIEIEGDPQSQMCSGCKLRRLRYKPLWEFIQDRVQGW